MVKSRNTRNNAEIGGRRWSLRRGFVLCIFLLLGSSLVIRALQLQVLSYDYYQNEGSQRQLRHVAIPAHRGMLLDRHGEPLAISTPIQTLVGNPKKLVDNPDKVTAMAEILSMDAAKLVARVKRLNDQKRVYMYVKRHVLPELVEEVVALDIEGLTIEREFRRFYPSGHAAAHVVGFTDIDDKGREGLEMAYDEWLQGRPGKRKVMRDRTGRYIEGVGLVEKATPGRDLHLSLDKQLQYFADRALAEAVKEHQAESANLVVMNVKSGEVLAMVNYPTYNPNDTSDRSNGSQRNRSITDVFEPGSTMKPFTMAAALDSGKFNLDDIVYTSPGHYTIGKYKISDIRDNGWLDLSGIITKSSNVGISKVARELEPEQMWSVFDSFGFGRPTGSEFPGEVAGYFNHPTLWHHIEQASVSYGYGLSVSALQLVRAYSAIANDGAMPPVSFIAVDTPEPTQQVVDIKIAKNVQDMLERAVLKGTGHRAKVPGYRVGGKTGTSHRSQSGGYAEDRYVSLFAGFAPVSDPELAAVVVIHDPKGGEHFGSVVAAPIFSEVMGHALRLQGVEPDDIDGERAEVLQGLPLIDAEPGDRS